MSKLPVVPERTYIIQASFLLTLKDTARRCITQPEKIDLPLYTQCARTAVETQLRGETSPRNFCQAREAVNKLLSRALVTEARYAFKKTEGSGAEKFKVRH